MPLPDALIAAEQFRALLLRREREVAMRLVNAYGDIYVKLQGQIDALIVELDVMAAEGQVSVWKAGRLDSLKRMKASIETEVTRYGALVENEVNQGAKLAIVAGQESAKKTATAGLPGAPIDAQIMATWQSLDPAAVETMLGFLSADSPLRVGLRETLGKAVADGVGQKLLEGISLGYNPRKTARIIRDELGQGLDWSLRTARTSTLYAYRESTRAAYVANPEIVKGWTWRSARLPNTCMSCIAMDGSEHPNTEKLDDHFSGACVMLPLTVSYKDLGFDVEEPPPVLEHPTGESWFKAQPEKVQRQMMGPGKFEAWRKGEIQLKDLPHVEVDPTYGPMRSEASLKSLLGVK